MEYATEDSTDGGEVRPARPAGGGIRRPLAEEIVDFLSEGVSVHLVGVAGSGRSHALASAADLLGEGGRRVVRLAGVRPLRDRPLAALAVAGVPLATGQGAASLAAAVDALVQRVETPGTVVVVDDGDDVDEVSLGALAAARARVPFPVLAAARPDPGTARAATLTARTQPAVRLRVGPLRLDQVHAAVHEMLPGLVEATTVARLATLSGGLPALLRAVVAAGRRTGALSRQQGVWRAGGDLWDPMLAAAVEPLLQDLDAAERDALGAVAAAGELEVAASAAHVGPGLLARLHARGLLTVTGTCGREVATVYPPLLEDHLQRAASLADPLGPDHGLGDGRGEPASAVGTSIDRQTVPVLSRRVWQHWRRVSEDLREQWQADPCSRTALELVRAMNAGGADPRLIEHVIASTDRPGDEPTDRAVLDAWSTLYRVLSRRRLEPVDPAADPQPDAPGQGGLIEAVRLHTELVLDRVPEVSPLLRAPGQPEIEADAHALARLGSLLAAGRVGDAQDEVRTVARPRTAHILAQHHDAYDGLADVLSGDVEAGTATATHHLARALDDLEPDAIQAHAYVGALGLVLRGRLDEVEQLLTAVLTVPGATPVSAHFRAGLLGWGAQIARWQGREDYAARLWSQGQDIGAGAGPFPGMLAFEPQADVSPADLGAQVWALADDRSARGYHVHALFLAGSALELPVADPDRAAAITRAARECQGRLLPAVARYVEAASRRDEAALGTAAAELDATGDVLHATAASVARAVALHEAGRATEAGDQAEAAWGRAGGFGTARRALFAPLRAAVGLSGREQEIAALLGEGLSAARVASVLGVSHRTVEGHILRACHRLGVTTRDRLAAMARTWLL